MKSDSVQLIALMSSNQAVIAGLYSLTLIGGTVYRFTDFDIDLPYDGQVYSSTGLILQRGNIKTEIGLGVNTMSLDAFADDAQLMQGLPFLQFAHNGGLRGAHLLYQKAYLPPDNLTDTSAGVLHGFDGKLHIRDLTRDTCHMEVRSGEDVLNVMMPREVYQPECPHTPFDTRCGLSKAAFEVAGTVATNSANARVVATSLTNPDGYFTGGTLRFASGSNTGALATVLGYAGGVFTLMRPLVDLPSAGDNIVACPSCPRTLAGCEVIFNNRPHFGGKPFIPSPETAI